MIPCDINGGPGRCSTPAGYLKASSAQAMAPFNATGSTLTNGNYTLIFQPSCNIVIKYNPTGKTIWSSKTGRTGTPCVNGRLVMLPNANLVAYATAGLTIGAGSRVVWSNKPPFNGVYKCASRNAVVAVMQFDGNLVVYCGQKKLWNTNTAGKTKSASATAIAAAEGTEAVPLVTPTTASSFDDNAMSMAAADPAAELLPEVPAEAGSVQSTEPLAAADDLAATGHHHHRLR